MMMMMCGILVRWPSVRVVVRTVNPVNSMHLDTYILGLSALSIPCRGYTCTHTHTHTHRHMGCCSLAREDGARATSRGRRRQAVPPYSDHDSRRVVAL